MNFGIETEKLEYKASLSQLPRGLESLAAMLNKHGEGEVLFGVNDDGEVIGVSIGNKTIKDISEQIAEKIKPVVIPTINVEYYEDKVVIRVKVTGSKKPYSASGNYLIRVGSENRKIEPDDLRDLILDNSGDDIITELEARNQELTFESLKSLYLIKKVHFDDNTFEKNLGLLTKNGKYNMLAELLSDNNDVSIKVARFQGTNKDHMLKRNEYGYTNLILAMEQALNFVNSLNETNVELSGKAQRDEQKLFDGDSFREAWINACLHNRWDKGTPPAIYIYSDRIDIISTGGLPKDFDKEDFYRGVSRVKNKSLQKIMGQLGYVEQMGYGVPLIVENYGEEAFEFLNGFIIVTLKFNFEPSSNSVYIEGLTQTEKKVLGLIKTKPVLSKKELAEILDYGETTVSNAIKKLRNLNMIERVGSNKTGYWKTK